MQISAADEGPHTPTSDDWVEAWLFDAVQHDRSIALSIEMLVWPQHGRLGFHASVLRTGQPLISLVEYQAPAPRPPSLEVRAPGLWTEVGIQTPLDHVTVDIEAFAVALDDPEAVLGNAYGIRTALGSELEWDTAGAVVDGRSEHSYEIPCLVHGELLIDEARIEFDGWGWRSHRWGSPGIDDRSWIRGRNSDGQWFRHPEHILDVAAVPTGVPAPVPDPVWTGRVNQSFVATDESAYWLRDAQPIISD